MRILGLSLLLLSSACSTSVQDIYSVPADPTYEKDVRFYLEDHCVLCHGSPPNRGAPKHLRLDVYDDTDGKLGASSEAGSIDDDANSGRMPPGGGLGPNGKQMLKLWAKHGAPR